MICSNSVYRRFGLVAGAVAAILAQASVPAWAQESSEDQATATQSNTGAEALEAIVVTGSRIRRDEFNSSEPVTVITAEEITQAGFISGTDALQSTAVTAGSSQINNIYAGYVVDGGTGVNTLSLRNLGPARTLVLLNGRRLAPAGTRGSVLAADLNVLPTGIIDRIEILEAGASSIYGSDAVAGVVNVMTDTAFRGFELEAQVNAPEINAGDDMRVSASFGFGTDKLDLIGSFEYRKRNRVSRNDQDWFDCPVGGYLSGKGTPFGSGNGVGFDGSPCFTLDNGGTTINTLGVPTRLAESRVTGTIGGFNRLVPDASVVDGPTPGYKGVTFYSRDTFSPAMEEEDLYTPVEIYTGFLQATYGLDALGNAELFGELLATRRESSSLLWRQLSIDYTRGSLLIPEIFRDGAFLAPNSTSSGQIVAARAFVDAGLTNSAQEVDYVRLGVGLRGDFIVPDWRYEAYAGRSWTHGTYEIESFLTDRVANSLQVVQNEDGSFTCASILSNPNCVAAPPLNADTIGGRLPQEWRDYILQNTIGINRFFEDTLSFTADGPIFQLPYGDVQLVVGAEYRDQKINDTPDGNAISGNLLGLTSSVPTRGTDSVTEFFGEIFIPILADRPFFESLSLNGSARYTDYDSYGSDTTYKVAAEWQIVKGFGLRSSYGTSFRAPALAEQFLGATSGFASAAGDPCDADNYPADPADYSATQQTRAANCAAVGIDVTSFQQNSSIRVFTLGGAELGLAAETSKNFSVGAVISPPLPEKVGSLSFALDYFDIEVNDGVSTLSSGTILSRCYGDTDFDPNAGFCRFVSRDANNLLSVNSGYINLSTDIVKGYEFTGRFASDIFNGRMILNLNLNKYTEQSTRQFADEFLTDANGITTVPDMTGTVDLIFSIRDLTLRYGVEWVGASSGTYDYFAFSNQTGQVNQALSDFYQEFYQFEVDDYYLHSFSVQYRVSDKLQITVGARNLYNERPPEISADGFFLIGNSPLYSGYDFIGRSFFANTVYKF